VEGVDLKNMIIKITKKELIELLEQSNNFGMSIDDVEVVEEKAHTPSL
jgi:hypothetical protein